MDNIRHLLMPNIFNKEEIKKKTDGFEILKNTPIYSAMTESYSEITDLLINSGKNPTETLITA